MYFGTFVFSKTKISIIEVISENYCYGESVLKLVRKFERTDLRC